MKYLLLGTLLIFLAIGTFAQISSPTEVTTKDGQIIILKPDGTWEFKEITPQSSPTPTLNTVKLSNSTDSLPLNFTGQDTETILTRLRDLKERLRKGEFETTAQYEKRIAEEIQKPIIDNLTLKDTFFLVMPNVEAEYNADMQSMRFLIPIFGGYTNDIYEISGFGENRSSYIIVFKDVNKWIPIKRFYVRYFSIEISLNVEEAKRLKTTTKAVALVKIEKPYLVDYDDKIRVQLIDFYLIHKRERF